MSDMDDRVSAASDEMGLATYSGAELSTPSTTTARRQRVRRGAGERAAELADSAGEDPDMNGREARMEPLPEAHLFPLPLPLLDPDADEPEPRTPLHVVSIPESASPRRRNGSRAAAAPSLRRILEAVLFASDRPVTLEQLHCAVPDEEAVVLETELRDLAAQYISSGCGFQLHESGEGFWLRTDPELHEHVHRFLVGKKRSRLSRAAMETLAIIAYRQPITRGEVEEIRGVDCGQVLHTLLERDLAAVRGRSQALGRPLLYGTTDEFLHYFGIRSLSDLPSPEELQALLGTDPMSDPEIQEALTAQGLLEDPDSPEAAGSLDDENPVREALDSVETSGQEPAESGTTLPSADAPDERGAPPFDAGESMEGPLQAAC